MSTLTKIWTEEKIRDIIRHLDEKTGLSGATLPIAFNSYGNLLGYYRYVKPKAFGFNRKFFDDPSTGEAEVIDVIRHEYAHYYVDVANLELFVGHSRREMSHGDDWKWACGMVGADPTRCHNTALFMGKIWSDKDAMAAYNASDIPKCDIIPYLKRWNAVPINVDTAIKINARIKERTPDSYYEIGDEVLHPERGFGFVHDTIPYDYFAQKVYVRFEDGSFGVFTAPEICKIVDGVAVTYRRK